jgi:cyclophilin family peptidyl-prolyl cis-trans isomerase/HEAT repeat protein
MSLSIPGKRTRTPVPPSHAPPTARLVAGQGWRLAAILAGLAAIAVAAAAAAQPALRERVLVAEDQRAASAEGIAVFKEALSSSEPITRRQAVRAIGRLERPELIPLVAARLTDGVGIRAEAANALAQMARTPAAAIEVQRLLLERAAIDREQGLWEVWGEIAAAVGRLPYGSAAEIARAEGLLVQGLPAPDSLVDVETPAVVGAVRGFDSLARTARKVAAFEPRSWDLLRWAATAQRPPADPRSAWIRRLAMSALVTGGQATASVIDRALNDADAEVRRLAALAAGTDATAERTGLVRRAMADRDARVRWEGLRGWRRTPASASCAPVRAALRDADPQVKLLAIDLLSAGCPDGEPGPTELDAIVETLNTQPRGWHAPAHALVSLAAAMPDRARQSLPRFVQHPTWQVRMYAARAAGRLAAVEALVTLGRDAHHNVREAALAALVELKRPEATAVALDALTMDDYQLTLTAARALSEPAAAGRSVPALVAALARITRQRKDTSRDPRMAILDRLEALDARAQAADLEPYLRDFDPRVAQRTAEILGKWTGQARAAAPQPLATPPVTTAMVDALRGRRLRFTMGSAGAFEIALDLDGAPLSAVRVAQRAAEGYYNGLTFHRLSPNFVIQGGSPGANEYAGDALYMRDEVGIHTRGTVGISTRGRDTGDAQVFVNLVDSPRLDHNYTVIGTVTSGMDVVDGVLEGDVITSVAVVGR